MFKKLLSIYGNRIIKPSNTLEPMRFYYFFNEDGELFGIDKTITKNEYHLIKSMYIEKTFHFNNALMQQIHEYLWEGKGYPFSLKRGKFFLYQGLEDFNIDQFHSMLMDIFQEIYAISFLDYTLVFYFSRFDIELEPLFQTLSDDFGSKLLIHEGFFFTDQLPGEHIRQYAKTVIDKGVMRKKDYTDLADFILALSGSEESQMLRLIKNGLFASLKDKDESLEIIRVFFNNNLNVSATAKSLYMHRNTLLYKLDQLSKELGLKLDRFSHACSINILLNIK
ncbi:MAG: helix-turn-helix domain-containing protein [Bacilli bacterium]|jgi:hypothetical protein|nr:helix-turn-helix domain-containing protein [Bacilli bacterium]HHU24308.1 hypothetical protein [Acholeplasmataceae bacterium]